MSKKFFGIKHLREYFDSQKIVKKLSTELKTK